MNNNTNKRLLAFAVVGVLLATMLIGGLVAIFSTNSRSTDNPISGLTIITPKDNALQVGETFQLEARGTSVTGQTRTVADKIDWVSLDTAIATIDDNGVVTANAKGKVKIQATLGGLTAEDTLITYNNAGESVEGSLAGNFNIVVGNTTILSATFPNSNVSSLVWSSANEAVATVDSTGTVTGISGGTARITARISNTNIVAIATVTVAGQGQVSEIQMPGTLDLTLGVEHTLQYTLLPTGVTADVKFEVDDRYATVDNGVLKTIAEGTFTLTATVGNVVAYSRVTISDIKVTSLAITGDNTTTVGEILSLSVVATPSNALQIADWDFAFADPNNHVVRYVDKDGNPLGADWQAETSNTRTVYLEAIAEGQVTFVAKRNGVESKGHTITVGPRLQVTSVLITRDNRFDGDTITVAAGAPIPLNATTMPKSARPDIRWASSNQHIAKLATDTDTPDIEITPLQAGTATITARATDKDGKEYEDSITLIVLNDNVNDIDEVYINGQFVVTLPIRVVKGDTVQLKGTTKPSNVPTAVRYESDNVDFATVDPLTGLVTAVSPGEALIRARVAGNDSVNGGIGYAAVQIVVIETPDATKIEINGASTVPSGTRSQYTATTTPMGVEQEVIWSRADGADNSETATGVKVEFVTIDDNGDEVPSDTGKTNKDNGIATIRLTRSRNTDDTVKGTGKVILTATHTNTNGTEISTTHTVTVSPNPIATDIEITGQAEIGAEVVKLQAKAWIDGNDVLSEGVRQHFVWRSLNEDIAQLSTTDDGATRVTGLTPYEPTGVNTHLDEIWIAGNNAGTATIEAQIPNTDVRAQYQVKVTVNNKKAMFVTVLPVGFDYATIGDLTGEGTIDNDDIAKVAQADLYDGGEIKLQATAWDSATPIGVTDVTDPGNPDVTTPPANVVGNVSIYWWSANEHIASVDQGGVVKFVEGYIGKHKVDIYAEVIGTGINNKTIPFVITVDSSKHQLVVDFVANYGVGGSNAVVEINPTDTKPTLITLGTTDDQSSANDALNYITAKVKLALIDMAGISLNDEAEEIKAALNVSTPSSISSVVSRLEDASNPANIYGLIATAINEPSQQNIDAVEAALTRVTGIIGTGSLAYTTVIQGIQKLINA